MVRFYIVWAVPRPLLQPGTFLAHQLLSITYMTKRNLKTLTIIVFEISNGEILHCMGGDTPTSQTWHIFGTSIPPNNLHDHTMIKTLSIIVFEISYVERLLCMGGATPTFPIWNIFGISIPLNNIYDYTKFEESNNYIFRDIIW